ncbi:MAG: HupE/UreJ family protein [Bacteroidota bacterium]
MKYKPYLLRIFCIVSLTLGLNQVGLSHAPNQSYIYLSILKADISGRFEINTQELSDMLDQEVSADITRAKALDISDLLQAYYRDHVQFSSILGSHRINFGEVNVLRVGSLGTFLQLEFDLEGVSEIPDELEISYQVYFDRESSHRGLLQIENNWKAGVRNNEAITALIFSKSDSKQTLDLTSGNILVGTVAMIKEGIWHIWIGIDHILFLLALILPSVIVKSSIGNRESTIRPIPFIPINLPRVIPVSRFKDAFLFIIKVVTFFTIAHTITLSLAALQLVILPSRFVESIIAISIALAAFHNIKPIFKGQEWILSFGFGLFHGFGFASVLSEIGMVGEYLGYSLFGFNIGVELGQLAIILVIFPILFLLRKLTLYQKFYYLGSIMLIFISLYWFTERAFDVDLQLANTLAAWYRALMGTA